MIVEYFCNVVVTQQAVYTKLTYYHSFDADTDIGR